MNDNDLDDAGCRPTATGISLCLRMLADEATTLNLRRTVQALRAAITTVEAEANPSAGPLDHSAPRLKLAAES